MSDEVKIKSKTDVKKIAKGLSEGKFSSEEILDNCRRLWKYASELADRGRRKDGNNGIDFKNIYAIREVCDVIGQLGEHLETDEQKLTVLTMSYRNVIDRLDFFDGEHPAEPVERISAEYSFSFLNKIISSIENSDYREEIKKNIDYSRNESSKKWYSDHRFLDYLGEKSSFKNRANDVARSILLEIERTKKGSETSDLLGKPVLNNKKLNIPYYQVAKQALMNWNGLSEEEADKKLSESTFEEIEGMVGAQGSMTTAATTIGKSLGLSDEEITQFIDEVFGRTESTEMSEKLNHELGAKMLSTFRSSRHNFMPQLITDTMEAVHDDWIKANAKYFFTKKADKKQQYQFLPSELIGWDEAKSDLLFIKPIIHAIGGYADEAEIKEECNKRTVEYFKQLTYSIDEGTMGMRVHNLADLGSEIAENGLLDNYEPLDTVIEGTNTTLRGAMADSQFVTENLLPQLREKGFMKDEELMDKLSYSNSPIFDPDGPSRDEILEELESLRDEKQKLVEQEKTISETEKLIETKENQGPNLDE